MRIVVKVGTSTLAYATGRLNIRHTEKLVEVLSDLKNEGHEVILVSSGAIGMGVGKLSLPTRPSSTIRKKPSPPNSCNLAIEAFVASASSGKIGRAHV